MKRMNIYMQIREYMYAKKQRTPIIIISYSFTIIEVHRRGMSNR